MLPAAVRVDHGQPMSPDTVLSLLADLRTATHRCLWAAAEASLVGSGGAGARRAARSARMSLWELHESALLAARSRRDARALADLLTAADQLGIVAGAAERLATVRLTDAPAVTRGRGPARGRGRSPPGSLTCARRPPPAWPPPTL